MFSDALSVYFVGVVYSNNKSKQKKTNEELSCFGRSIERHIDLKHLFSSAIALNVQMLVLWQPYCESEQSIISSLRFLTVFSSVVANTFWLRRK